MDPLPDGAHIAKSFIVEGYTEPVRIVTGRKNIEEAFRRATKAHYRAECKEPWHESGLRLTHPMWANHGDRRMKPATEAEIAAAQADFDKHINGLHRKYVNHPTCYVPQQLIDDLTRRVPGELIRLLQFNGCLT